MISIATATTQVPQCLAQAAIHGMYVNEHGWMSPACLWPWFADSCSRPVWPPQGDNQFSAYLPKLFQMVYKGTPYWACNSPSSSYWDLGFYLSSPWELTILSQHYLDSNLNIPSNTHLGISFPHTKFLLSQNSILFQEKFE